ncbi:MAG: transglycosylase domain-containing protein [Omnitrophica WOR_2 bacterium]
MPSVPQIVRFRERTYQKTRRSPAGKAALGCSLLLSLAAVFAALFAVYFYAQLASSLPSLDALPALLDAPGGLLLQPTRLYDRSGTHLLLALENPAAINHRYLKVDQLPVSLVKATIARAEPSFWSSPGFSWQNLAPEQHATLAQQLVYENLLKDESPDLPRALQERFLAAQAVSRFGREKVLEWYLNSTQYGSLLYGADAASRAYFGKPAEELTLAESAVLVAASEAPDLNPVAAAPIVLARQKEVIQAMVDNGLITFQQAQQASQQEIRFQSPTTVESEIAPAFTHLALEQLESKLGKERVERGGLHILTTLDFNLQVQANCAAAVQLKHLMGVPEGDITSCPSARLLPTLPVQKALPPGYAVNVVILDPANDNILAMEGDPSAGNDPAHLPGHSPGSLLTPFIYLSAFTRGSSPATLVWDIPASLPVSLRNRQGNQGDFAGPLRIRSALANDHLAPALQILQQVGPEDVARILQQMGVGSIDLASLEKISQAWPLLSGGETTLLEMSQAYGVFAAQGILAGEDPAAPGSNATAGLEPVTILQAQAYDGRVWMDCTENITNCSWQKRPVVSPQLAYLVNQVLSDETARWPSLGHPNPLEIGRPVGAKIGSSGDGKNAWTIGFTPQILVGVWIGSTTEKAPGYDPKSLQLDGAAAIWHAITQYTVRDLPARAWEAPPNITHVTVCDPSGMLPTPYCPATVDEIYINGNEPVHPDNIYRAYAVNRETGKLASVFTPPGLVEERVYLLVPPEAAEWAQSEHLPVPPDSYDVVYPPASTSPDAAITSPGMFSYVTGNVILKGNAGGNGFDFFRVQIGKGFNPQEWIQLGQDRKSPVKGGELGRWDTAGLSGLYAIQLQVVHKDQSIQSAIIQVTVDNTPPEVSIHHPAAQQVFSAKLDSTIVLQAGASDDLALDRVEFYLDNRLISTLVQAPFMLAWESSLGKHTFTVKAYDQAGNSSQSTVIFTVNP